MAGAWCRGLLLRSSKPEHRLVERVTRRCACADRKPCLELFRQASGPTSIDGTPS